MAFLKFLITAVISLLWIAFLVFLCILSLAFESEAALLHASAAVSVGLTLLTAGI